MPKEILLLTDEAMAGLLGAELTRHAPMVALSVLTSMADVEERFSRGLEGARLIAAGTDVILSQEHLNALPGPAYNLHPGPPEYPGLFPSVFALYDGAAQFGTTVHEMALEVDSGPIIAVERFDIPAEADRMMLDRLSLASLMGLFSALADRLALSDDPLSPVEESWGQRKWTRKDFAALCQLPEDVDEAEFQRRHRAVGEGPDHALEITLFGNRFALDNRRAKDPVYVAGLSAERDSSA